MSADRNRFFKGYNMALAVLVAEEPPPVVTALLAFMCKCYYSTNKVHMSVDEFMNCTTYKKAAAYSNIKALLDRGYIRKTKDREMYMINPTLMSTVDASKAKKLYGMWDSLAKYNAQNTRTP